MRKETEVKVQLEITFTSPGDLSTRSDKELESALQKKLKKFWQYKISPGAKYTVNVTQQKSSIDFFTRTSNLNERIRANTGIFIGPSWQIGFDYEKGILIPQIELTYAPNAFEEIIIGKVAAPDSITDWTRFVNTGTLGYYVAWDLEYPAEIKQKRKHYSLDLFEIKIDKDLNTTLTFASDDLFDALKLNRIPDNLKTVKMEKFGTKKFEKQLETVIVNLQTQLNNTKYVAKRKC